MLLVGFLFLCFGACSLFVVCCVFVCVVCCLLCARVCGLLLVGFVVACFSCDVFRLLFVCCVFVVF